ncbi:hypothetical protein AUP68_09206 [Ilyonectria robusta]
MSTSSGRKGSCTRCGHQMNEHAKSSESKCKKCKKVFDICQVPYHGLGSENSGGWRICYVPCACGNRYYSDKARAARPLEPHEYIPGHPGYRPIEQEATEHADMTGDEDLSTYTASTDTTRDYTAQSQSYGMFTEHDSNPSVLAASPPDAGPSNVGHRRTVSNSTDPLHWDEERFREETSMASLAQQLDQAQLDDNEVQQDDNLIDGTESTFVAEFTLKKDQIQFKNVNGQKSRAPQNEWTMAKVYYEAELVDCLTYLAPSGNRYYMWLPSGYAQGESSTGPPSTSRRRKHRS